MCRLVIRAPRSYCISHVATTEFDLRVFAHVGNDRSREAVESECDIAVGRSEYWLSSSQTKWKLKTQKFEAKTAGFLLLGTSDGKV